MKKLGDGGGAGESDEGAGAARPLAAGPLEDPPLEDRNDEEGVEVFEAMSQVVLLVDDARDEQHRERVNDPI